VAAELCATSKVNRRAETPHHLGTWLPVRATQRGVMHTSEGNSSASRIIFLAQMAQHHEENRMTLI